MENIVRIFETGQVTHDVKYFRVTKPEGFRFRPGEATDLSIYQPGLEAETRPFTFTSLNDNPYLEFTIKKYDDHHGITSKLHQLNTGDELIVREPWGAIEYKGPGYFIAGGAGITPFISILRDLHQQQKASGNTLFFSNRTGADMIYEDEFRKILGEKAVFIATQHDNSRYLHARIDGAFFRKNVSDFSANFYVCGPDAMVKEITDLLASLGAKTDAVVFEK